MPKISGFEAVPGHGIRGFADGQRVILGNRRMFRDERIQVETAEAAMTELEGQGKTAMLAASDNKLIGIIAVADTLKPEAREAVAAFKLEGVEVILLSGDNRRTAEAIGRELGIAIGSGSDVAKETGGIILVKDHVRDVVASIRLSRATLRKIKQNLFWAFIYNTVGIPIAALGFLNRITAAAVMALSSLSVIVNSALLKRAKVGV